MQRRPGRAHTLPDVWCPLQISDIGYTLIVQVLYYIKVSCAMSI